ncbi:MAG: hypothetical protein HZA53_08790 [Planctomycetes bacterium]|nr:hypothetical protein [Planctomycetota bacterium]
MPRSFQRLFLALVALVPFVAGCQATQDVETLFLPDREDWKRVHAADDGHQTVVEFVPQGQELAAWRELITVQGLDDRRPREAPTKTMGALRDAMRARGGKLEWSVIEESADSVLYEWTLAGAPGIEDQGELARLVLGKDAMHRAAYAYKGLPLAPERRADRLALLRNARVVKGAKEAQAAIEEFFPEYRKSP